jgi:hypothetical protein
MVRSINSMRIIHHSIMSAIDECIEHSPRGKEWQRWMRVSIVYVKKVWDDVSRRKVYLTR